MTIALVNNNLFKTSNGMIIVRGSIFVLMLHLSFIGAAQKKKDANVLFQKDFHEISAIYEKNAEPYLYRFASYQFPPLQESTKIDSIFRERQIENLVHIHKANIRAFIKESYDFFYKEKAESYKKADKTGVIDYFDFAFRTQFLYLDYQYFEKTKNEIATAK